MNFRRPASLLTGFTLGLCALLLPVKELDARPPPTCDVVDCSSGCYEVFWPAWMVSGLWDCDEAGDTVPKLLASFEAPAPGFVTCEGMGNGFFCSAYPLGEGLTYLWSSTGDVYLPYPGDPSIPFASFSCLGMGGASTVTVTVVSPFGIAATASMRVGRCSP